MANTTTLEIHPAIGIARVGSSTEFFAGPEPGVPIETNRRDASADRLLKRQAAVFRVFSCTRDPQGTIVDFEELTPSKAAITWTVHLANRKSAAPRFRDATGLPNTQSTPRRNNATGSDSADKDLIIEGGEHSLTGPSQARVAFQGSFRGNPVPLGEMTTDANGRLVVAGGFGLSQSSPATDITDFADNDNWHDDTSDGPVSATVHFLDGRPDPGPSAVKPAWVICCQPDFAWDQQPGHAPLTP